MEISDANASANALMLFSDLSAVGSAKPSGIPHNQLYQLLGLPW
jgi:hypothetical protein